MPTILSVLAGVEEIVETESLRRLELKGFGKPVEAFAVSAATADVQVVCRSDGTRTATSGRDRPSGAPTLNHVWV
jgi:hypothetical protein